MPSSLQSLVQELALARNERELRLPFMDAGGELFEAQHWGISLRNQEGKLSTVDLKGLPDSFIDYYTRFGTTIDPLREYVIKHHAPVHEQVLFTEESWKRSALYVHGCGLQYNHEHAMTGPIVGHGQLIGMVHFARTSGYPAFDAKDLANLSALCAHLSANLALLRVRSKRPISEWATQLTARELQIAELVAKGLTNAEIGVELWITQNSVKQALKRMFRKLNVSARAELVARLLQMENL